MLVSPGTYRLNVCNVCALLGDDLLSTTEDGEDITEVQRNTITLLESSSFGGVARNHARTALERRREWFATLINGELANGLQYYL